jgi:hypothetical protein
MVDHVGEVLGRVRAGVRHAVAGALLKKLEERLRANLEGALLVEGPVALPKLGGERVDGREKTASSRTSNSASPSSSLVHDNALY